MVNKALVVLAGGLMVLSVAAGFMSAWRPPPPLGVSPAKAIQLGDVPQGVTTNASFQLRNQSSYPIEIGRVVTSCGCSTAGPKDPVLEPGESTALDVTLASGAARGELAVRVTVVYRVRDPSEPFKGRLDLGVGATVDPDFLRSCESLTFGESLGETRSVTLTANRLSELEVSEAYCTHKAFRASVAPVEKAARPAYRVDVTFVPGDWAGGTGSAELMVRTNSQGEPVSRIPLEVKSSPSG